MNILWCQKLLETWREQENISIEENQQRTLHKGQLNTKKNTKKAKLKRKNTQKLHIPWSQKMQESWRRVLPKKISKKPPKRTIKHKKTEIGGKKVNSLGCWRLEGSRRRVLISKKQQ